jgi:serine/threonine-protein kinase HipA
MRKCPLSYREVEGRYDLTALHRVHPKLTDLADLPYASEELRREARELADKLSIQGVQPKLSARLALKDQAMEIVERKGHYILKPQHPEYPAVPENEDLTMHLAAAAGIEVPVHGLLYGADGAVTYFIQRFDRGPRDRKHPQEDFAQLLGEERETKYGSSMERAASALEQFATFPSVDAVALLRLVLFNFLVGNEDHHLKNFSLLQDKAVIRLSPAYDLLNTTILVANPKEEIALPLKGKKRGLTRKDLLEYFAGERLRLPAAAVEKVLRQLAEGLAVWPEWIDRSFLPSELQEAYSQLVETRAPRLGFIILNLEEAQRDLLDRPSLKAVSGGHQSYFRQLGKQRRDLRQLVTREQWKTARERVRESGGWQDAYRVLDAGTAT